MKNQREEEIFRDASGEYKKKLDIQAIPYMLGLQGSNIAMLTFGDKAERSSNSPKASSESIRPLVKMGSKLEYLNDHMICLEGGISSCSQHL